MRLKGLYGRLLCLALAGISALVLVTPGHAVAKEVDPAPALASVMASEPTAVKVNPKVGATPQVCAVSPKGTTTCVEVSPDGTLAPGLPAEVLAQTSGSVTPNFTVGLGWYVYVYLNRNDIQFLIGLGYTAATATICIWLASTVLGGVICAVVAAIIWEVINDYAYLIDPGDCLEIRFSYAGQFKGARVVRRNC
jgi:hypothetical protein